MEHRHLGRSGVRDTRHRRAYLLERRWRFEYQGRADGTPVFTGESAARRAS